MIVNLFKEFKVKKKQIIILSIISAILIFGIVIVILLTRHTHSFGEWEKFKDSSCAEFGIERRYCSCGDVQEKKINKLEHTESNWIFNAEENSRKTICLVCNRIIKFESLKDHTHSWGNWTSEKEATCTESGIKSRICECGAKDIIKISATGHDLTEWAVITESKCEIEGLKQRICLTCGHKETESINALSHLENAWVVKGNEKHFLCMYCGILLRIEEINKPSQNLEITDYAILGLGNCSDIDIVLPSTYNNYSIQIIGEQAFEYSNILSIIMPESLIAIKDDAFYQCSNLEIVHLGENVKTIGDKAFARCISLKTLSLPNSITNIGKSAFAYCSSLEIIYIGNNISKLEMRVFQDCKNLTSIYFNGTLEEWNAIEKDREWDLGTPDYIIYCTDGNINK